MLTTHQMAQSWEEALAEVTDLITDEERQALTLMGKMIQSKKATVDLIRDLSLQYLSLDQDNQDRAMLIITAATAVYRSYTDQLIACKQTTPEQSFNENAGGAIVNAYIDKLANNLTGKLIDTAYEMLTPINKARCSKQDWPNRLQTCLDAHTREAVDMLIQMLQQQEEARQHSVALVDAQERARRTQFQAKVRAIRRRYTGQANK